MALADPASPSIAQRDASRSIGITSVAVVGHEVTAHVRIVGWKMFPALVGSRFDRPDGGHWHLFVDGRYVGGTAAPAYTVFLPAGLHRLRGELVNDDHSPLRPPVFSRVVRVRVP